MPTRSEKAKKAQEAKAKAEAAGSAAAQRAEKLEKQNEALQEQIKELNEIIGEQESELRKWKAYGADYKAQYEHFANAIKTAYDAHSPETIEMIKNARARSNNYDIRPVQPRLRLATGAVNTAIIII